MEKNKVQKEIKISRMNIDFRLITNNIDQGNGFINTNL